MKKIVFALVIVVFTNCSRECNNESINKKLIDYTNYLINDALNRKEFPLNGISDKKEMAAFVENLNPCYYKNKYFKEYLIAYFLRQNYLENLSEWHFDIRSYNTNFEKIMTKQFIEMTESENKDFVTSQILIKTLEKEHVTFKNPLLKKFYNKVKLMSQISPNSPLPHE